MQVLTLGQLGQFDPSYVLAVMLFPRSDLKRKQFLARLLESALGELEIRLHKHPKVRSIAKRAGVSTSDPRVRAILTEAVSKFWTEQLAQLGGFSTLGGAPGLAQLTQEGVDNSWPAAIAGDIVIHVSQMAALGHQASVNKAVRIEQSFLREATTESGAQRGGSERFIREQWEHFKPAAHLLATQRTWQEECPDGRRGGPESYALTEKGLPGFLALSELFRRFVTTYRPHGRSEPLVSPRIAWRVPAGYPLPPARLNPLPLQDWKLAALEGG